MTNPAEELLDIVDEHDRVIGTALRGEVYRRGLTHRCVFILVRDPAGRIFVHRRTDTKLFAPGAYDMFVGGVVGSGETYAEASVREAEEELGVHGIAPRPLFKFLFEQDRLSWWCDMYEAEWDGPVSPRSPRSPGTPGSPPPNSPTASPATPSSPTGARPTAATWTSGPRSAATTSAFGAGARAGVQWAPVSTAGPSTN